MQRQRMLALRFDEIGLAYGKADRTQEAVASFRDSLDLYEILLNADLNDATLQPAIAKTYNDLANAYTTLEEHPRARAAYAKSRQLNHKVLLTESADSALGADQLDDEALSTYTDTVRLFQALAETQAGDSALNSGLPAAYENIGLAYALQGRHEDAQRAFQKSIVCCGTSLEADPGNTELTTCRARVRSHQGLVYGALGDYEKSKDAHARCLAIADALLIEDPADTNLRRLLASNSFALGQTHLRFAAFEKACDDFKTMLEDCMHPSAKALIAPSEIDSLYPLYVQAMGLLSHAGRTDESLQLQRAYVALKRYFVDLDPDNPDELSALADEYLKLGMASRRASRIDEARASFQSALDILVALASQDPENENIQDKIEPIRQRLSRIEEGR